MPQNYLTRRQLLRLATYGGALVLTGCDANLPPEPTIGAATTIVSSTIAPPDPPMTQTPKPTSSIVDTSSDVPLEIKIGQMFMVGFRGFAVDDSHHIVQDISERHLGGVVFFDYDTMRRSYERNIQSPAQVTALTASLQAVAALPLLIAVDQEGGRVARLHERHGFPPHASPMKLGQADDVQQTYDQALAIAQTMVAIGINQNLAPVVDVNINPNNPVIAAHERSFSADPQKVIAHARAFIQAHHEQGILCTLKHFPGHGSSRQDSHRGFVDVSETWSEMELEPYAGLIQAGLADAVMTAHVFNRQWDEDDPATLSPGAINGLLRDELGFDGPVFTDDIQMGAIREHYGFDEALRKTIEAGIDVIAIANNSIYDENVMARGVAVVKRLVDEGNISEDRIEQSYQRIMALKQRLN